MAPSSHDRLSAAHVVIGPNSSAVPVGDYAQIGVQTQLGKIFLFLTPNDATAYGRRLQNFFSKRSSPYDRGPLDVVPAGVEFHLLQPTEAPPEPSLPPPAEATSGDKLLSVGGLAGHRRLCRRRSTVELEQDLKTFEPDLVAFLHWSLARAVPVAGPALSRQELGVVKANWLRETLIILAAVRQAYGELWQDFRGKDDGSGLNEAPVS